MARALQPEKLLNTSAKRIRTRSWELVSFAVYLFRIIYQRDGGLQLALAAKPEGAKVAGRSKRELAFAG